jgi:non-specific protein-tyrosine kinase
MIKIKKAAVKNIDAQPVSMVQPEEIVLTRTIVQPETIARQSDQKEERPEEKTGSVKGLGRFIKTKIEAVIPQQRELSPEAPAEADEKPKSGWHSPNYSLSRSVTLDPAVLAANRCIIQRAPDSVEIDAYRLLRTRILQRCKETGGNTIMITSAVPGEGKTLTAINLALILARELLQTALLVDCDLRRQSVHRYLGYDSEKGLIDYLLNDTPVSELITWPGIEKLTVISGGRPFTASSELLGSVRMKELVADMKSRYPDRYVIFDVPPLLAGADALAFVPLVDHVVVTVSEGETSMLDVNKALQMVPVEKVLGLVLNKHQSNSDLIRYQARRPVAF